MTPEQLTALIIAITGLIGAFGVVIAQLRATHQLINSRMTELVESTKLASKREGELVGRDFESTRSAAAQAAEGRTGPPSGTPPASNLGTNTPGGPAKTP